MDGWNDGGIELLIPKKTGSILVFSHYLLNIMISTTQTLSQIKPQKIIGHIKQHLITSPSHI